MKTNVKTKKLAAIALSMCLATGAVAAIGYASNHGLEASAKTANYQVSEATMGYGEENKATGVTVTMDEPATLTLKNVAAGQYYLNVKITEMTGEDFFPQLNAIVDYDADAEEEQYGVGLSFNAESGNYIAVVNVKANSTITLTTYTANTYTVDAFLGDLFIGQGNDYYLSNVEISATAPLTLPLENAAASEYNITVSSWFAELEAGAEFKVKVNDGEEVTLAWNGWSGYSGKITVTENSTTLTVSTTNTATVTVDISMEGIMKVDPMPAQDTLNIYESVTYSYVATGTGYYSINYTNVNVLDADWSVSFKTSMDSFDETFIEGNNYPLYMVEGNTYYFTVTYMGTPYQEDADGNFIPSPSSATVKLSVDKWAVPTLKAYSDIVYVPVTGADEMVAINLDAKSDTYVLSLVGLPFGLYMMGVDITAHYGTNSVVLTAENGYSAEITITNEKTLWLTSDYNEEALTIGVGLGDTAEVLDPDAETEITLSGTNQTALYNLTLSTGEYALVIEAPAGVVTVYVDGVARDISEGYAQIEAYYEYQLFEIVFEYSGTEEITFTVSVVDLNA